MTATKQLQEALRERENTKPFPEEFIRALEDLLNSGLSCAQITSFLIVLRGMSELQDDYEEGPLLGKAVEILRIMQCLRTLDATQNNAEDADWS